MKIMLIEKEKPFASAIRYLLESRGYSVEFFSDAETNIKKTNILSFGNTTLNLSTCTLHGPEGSIPLSAKEFDCMRLFMQYKDNILSKGVLLTRVWGNESHATGNNVEVYVGFLRKKLAGVGSDIQIRVSRRLGYQLKLIPSQPQS